MWSCTNDCRYCGEWPIAVFAWSLFSQEWLTRPERGRSNAVTAERKLDSDTWTRSRREEVIYLGTTLVSASHFRF